MLLLLCWKTHTEAWLHYHCLLQIFHVFPKRWSALYFWVDLWPNSDSLPLYSHACQTSILLGDSGRPILRRVLIVCNRLWGLPLSPTVSKKVGACECEKEYPRLFPFTLPELRDAIHCHMVAVRCRSTSCSWSYLPFSRFLHFFLLTLFIGYHYSYLTVCLSLPALLFPGTHSLAYLVPPVLLVF